MKILSELWTKEQQEPEVKNSYQYVFELREKLEKTLDLARELKVNINTIMIGRPSQGSLKLMIWC